MPEYDEADFQQRTDWDAEADYQQENKDLNDPNMPIVNGNHGM